MAQSTDTLIAAVLDLPPEERERLIDAVSSSLVDDDDDIDEELAKVLTRRAEELRSGAVKGIPYEEVKAGAQRIIAEIAAKRKQAL